MAMGKGGKLSFGCGVVLGTCLLFPSLVFSKVPGRLNPGAVQKSIENVNPVRPSIEEQVSPGAGKGEIRVLVRTFKFHGNRLLSNEYLMGVVAEYVGETLSLQDLQEVCEKIRAAYRSKGYPNIKVFIPPQGIEGDTVTVKIVEN